MVDLANEVNPEDVVQGLDGDGEGDCYQASYEVRASQC